MRVNRKTEQARLAFAQRLQRAIDEMGYKVREQTALGELFGVSGQAVRKWLDGTTMPGRDKMADVAAVLAVQRAWLEYGEGQMRPQHAIGETQGPEYGRETIELKEGEISVLLAMRRLDEDDRDAVERIVKGLAGMR